MLIVPKTTSFSPLWDSSLWSCPVSCDSESPHPPNGPHNLLVARLGVIGQAEQGHKISGPVKPQAPWTAAWVLGSGPGEQQVEVYLGIPQGSPTGSG